MSPTGLVFDVQRFSVHDGPGIRTTVFLKGCPLRCAWCQNPESLATGPEMRFDEARCEGDAGCAEACPLGAIQPGADRIDRARCDACGQCVAACPYGALEQVGRTMTVDEVLELALRDRPFYGADGGLTLSGGEPTLQATFARAAVRACRAADLPVGLQTCGATRWQNLEALADDLQFIHFDLKAIDPARHRALTGSGNEHILANARRLVAAAAPVTFRTPLVPGHNDRDEDLVALAGFLVDLGVKQLHLLRYHPLGESKLPGLGFPLAPLELGPEARDPAHHTRAAARLGELGLEVPS